MMNQHRGASRKVGRPPAGIGGEKVAEYPQVSVRVPPHVRAMFNAVSAVRGQPHWRIMMEAIDNYVDSLSPADRRAVEQMMRSNAARQ